MNFTMLYNFLFTFVNPFNLPERTFYVRLLNIIDENRVPTFRLTGLFVSPDFSLRPTGCTRMRALMGMTTAAVAAAASSKQAAGMLHQITMQMIVGFLPLHLQWTCVMELMHHGLLTTKQE